MKEINQTGEYVTTLFKVVSKKFDDHQSKSFTIGNARILSYYVERNKIYNYVIRVQTRLLLEITKKEVLTDLSHFLLISFF